MLLTSLMALAFGLSANLNVNYVQVGAVDMPYDKAIMFSYSHTLMSTELTSNWTDFYKVELHYDDNYNEYLQVNFNINFTDFPVVAYFSQDGWLYHDYNVNAYSVSYLYDTTSSTVKCSWVSSNNLLGTGERSGYGFGGDSDTMSVSRQANHSYTLYSYLYLYLVDDFDTSASEDYAEGYNNGYTEGYETGTQNGTTDGYNNGYNDGYNNGYNTGKTDGYTQGYNTALAGHDFSFTNLFASISDTPILMIRRLFGFEIFGTSVMAIFMSLFTALIVIKVLKKVF